MTVNPSPINPKLVSARFLGALLRFRPLQSARISLALSLEVLLQGHGFRICRVLDVNPKPSTLTPTPSIATAMSPQARRKWEEARVAKEGVGFRTKSATKE